MTLKLTINPGGHLSPEEVYGRDEFIKELWRVLDKQSLSLDAERRIGKTSILNKMEAETPEQIFAISRDVESIDDVHFFVAQLASDLYEHFSLAAKAKSRFSKLRASMAGAGIYKFKVPEYKSPIWQKEIEQVFKNVSEQLQEDQKLIVILDEFPWFLQKLMDNSPDGIKNASAVLDCLRQIRHHCRNIRFVFTGSIGIHHVIAKLKSQANNNQPLNDVKSIRVPTLEAPQAENLTNALMNGENLVIEEECFVNAVIKKTDCFPFYIHKLLEMVRQQKLTGTAETAETLIKQAIADEKDDWQLAHYEDRLVSYYGDIAPVCKSILDIACNEESISLPEIQNRLKVAKLLQGKETLLQSIEDPELLRKTMQKLCADNYLTQDKDNASYSFLYSLVKRWWQFHRGNLV